MKIRAKVMRRHIVAKYFAMRPAERRHDNKRALLERLKQQHQAGEAPRDDR
jgi:hypothetical protein